MTLRFSVAAVALLVVVGVAPCFAQAGGSATDEWRPANIRVGQGISITAVKRGTAQPPALAGGGMAFPHPRPRLAGFSPLVAITTSSKRSPVGADNYEHLLETTYDCNPFTGPIFPNCGALNPPATQNYVIGVLDTGADASLLAGSHADTLGVFGQYLTDNTIQIGGVGGTVDAFISQPIGFYAAGLSAVQANGTLNHALLRGHSNASIVVAPPIDCDEAGEVTGVMGMPVLAFHNTVIRVDTPRIVNALGRTWRSPEVLVQPVGQALPNFPRRFAMQFVGLSPLIQTAAYFPNLFDPDDHVTPVTPTLLALFAGTIPTGGLFFAEIRVLQGEPSPINTAIPMRVMVDTGSQASIMSSGMAANLNLPLEPDFEVAVCGVAGVVETIPGYYIDFVRINALGGAMDFSRAPFVILDLPSPDGMGVMDGILGMNFFWNRNVVFEPSFTSSPFFHVSDPIPFAYGDFNSDMHVDAADAATLHACFFGTGTMVGPDCGHVDADDDFTVDLREYAAFQRCYSGATAMADPLCTP